MLSERLIRGAALLAVVGALTFNTSYVGFSAGAEGCTQDIDNETSKCDGVNGEICTRSVSTCKSGSALSSCENGEGNKVNCTSTGGCGGDYWHAKTNASGC